LRVQIKNSLEYWKWHWWRRL